MSDFRYKLARFMYGRYGQDALYNALFIFELVFLFSGAVCSFLGYVKSGFAIAGWVLYVLALGCIVWAVFRMMSRNIAARQRENDAWLRLWGRVTSPFRAASKPTLPPDTDTHVFRACPACGAVLRLPRSAGKHTARCPRCSKAFTVRIK